MEKWVKRMEGEKNKRKLNEACGQSLRSVERRSVGVAAVYIRSGEVVKEEF